MTRTKTTSEDELRTEYKRSDFKTIKRGKYYNRVKANSNVVILDDEMTEVFPNSAAVNRALHTLVEAAQKTSGRAKRSSGTAKKTDS